MSFFTKNLFYFIKNPPNLPHTTRLWHDSPIFIGALNRLPNTVNYPTIISCGHMPAIVLIHFLNPFPLKRKQLSSNIHLYCSQISALFDGWLIALQRFVHCGKVSHQRRAWSFFWWTMLSEEYSVKCIQWRVLTCVNEMGILRKFLF